MEFSVRRIDWKSTLFYSIITSAGVFFTIGGYNLGKINGGAEMAEDVLLTLEVQRLRINNYETIINRNPSLIYSNTNSPDFNGWKEGVIIGFSQAKQGFENIEGIIERRIK